MVFSLGDTSTTVSLYLMNRRGYTEYAMPRPYSLNDVWQLKKRGVKYLIKNPCWQPNTQRAAELKDLFVQPIGSYKGVEVYKL